MLGRIRINQSKKLREVLLLKDFWYQNLGQETKLMGATPGDISYGLRIYERKNEESKSTDKSIDTRPYSF